MRVATSLQSDVKYYILQVALSGRVPQTGEYASTISLPLLPPNGNRLVAVGDLRVPKTWRARLQGAFAPAPPFQGERATHASKVASEGPD